MKAEIADREKLCAGGEAKVTESGGGSSSGFNVEKLSEEEEEIYTKAVFANRNGEEAVMEHRKEKGKKKEEVKS